MTGTRRRADAALTSRLLCTLDALPRGWVRHAVGIGVPVALACYAAVFRTHGISDHLWFLGDQQRDWMAVQGAFADLPRVGTPVSTGGVSLGPVFYWVLWTIRQVLSPVFGNLPHVGAVGLVMLRSLSDGLLAAALLQRGVPVAAVGGILLVLVSSPFDGALAATIWNPGLSVTFVNLTVVLLLRWSARPWTLWRVGTLAATVWLAVQAHTPAVFVAAPVLLYLLWVASRDARMPWPAALRAGLTVAAVVLVLQLPFLLSDVVSSAGDGVGGRMARGVGRLISDPSSIMLGTSSRFLVEGTARLFVTPAQLPALALWVLAGLGATAFAWRREVDLLAVSILPVACAWLGVGLLEIETDTYWLLSLSAPLGLALLGGLAWRPARPRVAAVLVVGLLVTAAAGQPGRWREFDTLFKAPQYGAIVETLRGVVAEDLAVARVSGADDAARAVNPALLFELVGGVLETEGSALEISATGEVLSGGP